MGKELAHGAALPMRAANIEMSSADIISVELQ